MSTPPPIEPSPLQYATPVGLASVQPMFVRDGNDLLVPVQAELPRCCIRCAGTESIRKRANLQWYPPLLALLILVNLLVFVIVAMIVRKKGVAWYSLCEDHRRQRVRGIVVTTLLVLMIVVIPIVGFSIDGQLPRSSPVVDYLPAVIIVLVIMSLIAAIVVGRKYVPGVRPKKIDAFHMRLRGFGPEFLATIESQNNLPMARG